MRNTSFFYKLNDETLMTIYEAQIADLVERRNIHNPDLFKECFKNLFLDNQPIVEVVVHFSDLAGMVFVEYHKIKDAQTDTAGTADADDADSSSTSADEIEPTTMNENNTDTE